MKRLLFIFLLMSTNLYAMDCTAQEKLKMLGLLPLTVKYLGIKNNPSAFLKLAEDIENIDNNLYIALQKLKGSLLELHDQCDQLSKASISYQRHSWCIALLGRSLAQLRTFYNETNFSLSFSSNTSWLLYPYYPTLTSSTDGPTNNEEAQALATSICSTRNNMRSIFINLVDQLQKLEAVGIKNLLLRQNIDEL